MRKKLVYFFIFTLAIILQTSVLPVLFGRHILVDATLMAILAWALLDGYKTFFGWSIVLGFYYDFVGYSAPGLHALIFLLVVYAVSFLTRRLAVDLRGWGVAMLLIFILVSGLGSRLAVYLQDNNPLHLFWYSLGGWHLIAQLVFNLLLFGFWFWFIRFNKNFFQLTA